MRKVGGKKTHSQADTRWCKSLFFSSALIGTFDSLRKNNFDTQYVCIQLYKYIINIKINCTAKYVYIFSVNHIFKETRI